MTAQLAHIVRHPIKAIGWEELSTVTLSAGRTLPWDRHWAVAHEAANLEGDAWVPKRNFLRGVASPMLMAVRAKFDESQGRITLKHPTEGEISGHPDDEAEAARIVDWLRPLWPTGRPLPQALARAGEQPFTDMPDPFVSVLNLSSNRALGERLSQTLSIHRWRGNLWLDGLAPWEEFDLIGRSLKIGAAELQIAQRITRCRSTEGNPETGIADANTLGTLTADYGHQDFGVYARVTRAGPITTGDRVVIL